MFLMFLLMLQCLLPGIINNRSKDIVIDTVELHSATAVADVSYVAAVAMLTVMLTVGTTVAVVVVVVVVTDSSYRC